MRENSQRAAYYIRSIMPVLKIQPIYICKDACAINEREEGMDQTILLYSCHPRGGVCGVSVTSLEISNDISKLVTL